MAAPALAVVAKKAAAILLTDKRTWTVIGSVLAGLIVLCLLPAMVLMAMFGSVNDVDIGEVMAGIDQQQIIENMTPEQQEKMQILEAAVAAIEAEIETQELEADPLKAQIIFVCALTDHIDNENFYTDYISCFAGAEDDGQIFNNISAKFVVEFNTDDRAKILELYQNARESRA
jgi:ABC-type Na+ efflux pump permease subunit